MMDGILIVNKEQGFTSFDVVAKLRGILKTRKMGHTGTLDPMATGVLPVAIGKGTRLVELLTEKTKAYEAVLRLGVTTDTQDITGTILKEAAVTVSEERVKEACRSMVGDGLQVPPMYSALKVDGKRLYELAREGKMVERSPRPVTFHSIEVLGIALPLVRLRVSCSKGTYIRTLCHDLGESLGCGGCMEALTRIRSGAYTLENSHTLSEIEEAMREGRIEDWILPVEEVLSDSPVLSVPAKADRLLHNGNPLPLTLFFEQPPARSVRMYDSEGAFVGLYRWREDRACYYPEKMFL